MTDTTIKSDWTSFYTEIVLKNAAKEKAFCIELIDKLHGDNEKKRGAWIARLDEITRLDYPNVLKVLKKELKGMV